MIKLNHQTPTDEPITFLSLLSTKSDAPFGVKSDVSEISFSPDGLYLLTKDENNLIQLWCTNPVTRVDFTGDRIGKVTSLSNIDYAADSSTIVIWERSREEVTVVETHTGRSKVIYLCYFPPIASNFCPSSKRILIIDVSYQVTLISFDDTTSAFLGKIPMDLTSIDTVLLSPTLHSIVLIGRNMYMDLMSIFDYEMDPVNPRFQCSGSFEFPRSFSLEEPAKFTPDGSHLLIMENLDNKIYSFSLIKMPSRPLQKFTIAELNPKMSWSVLSLKTITIDRLQVLKVALNSYHDSVLNLLFDFSDGTMITDLTLQKESDMFYYGKHRLPISKIATSKTFEIAERHVTYINKNKQAVVVNYSGYIDRM
jgi:WD40 repeat protein